MMEYGTPRVPESGFDDNEKSKHYANIAASVQACTEQVLVEIAKRSKKYLDLDAICLAGGVALNGLANKRIRREVSQNLYVQPASGDSGTLKRVIRQQKNAMCFCIQWIRNHVKLVPLTKTT